MILMLRPFLLLLTLTFSSLSYTQVADWASGGKLKPEQAVMDIRHYTLTLNVDPSTKSINGSTAIDLLLAEPAPVLVFDFINRYKVSDVTVDGKKSPYTYESDLVTIRPGDTLAAGKHNVLIKYSGEPPVAKRAPWDGGFQWSKDSSGNDWIAITCQSEGAKIYFPSKDHPSDEPNEGVDMFITVPKGLVVAAPGLLRKTTIGKTTSTYHWKTNYTINTYSIVFNIGKYKVITRPYQTINGNTVPMIFYVLERDASKALHHLEILERNTRILEKYFGEFPWVKEKIGLAETPHLGMEHQTMNAYGNSFVYTKVGGQDFDWLMAHEFGHEWWANKVTGRNYADMWIQEGICTFGDHLQVRELEGEAAYLAKMRATGRNTQNVKPVVLDKDANSVDVYHGDIYGKGAFFMHTLRYIVGDSVFFPTLKKLATSPAYTYDSMPDTDDIEKLFSRASGKDLKPLFDFYLRTVKKLEIGVRQIGDSKFRVRLQNFDGSLPVEITTDKETRKTMISKEGLVVESSRMPEIDTTGYYIKRVILEY
jgi:aminopeptidase N